MTKVGTGWLVTRTVQLTVYGLNHLVIAKASAHGRILNDIQGGPHADFYDVAQLDRPGNPRSQGFAERSEAARELAKKVGVEIKHLYLTSGDSDLVIFVDAPSGDNVAKFALAVSSLGNVRTRTVRAWSAEEYRKLISELP